MHYFRADMFRADAEADDAGGDSAEKWNCGKQPDREWRLDRSRPAQYARNDPALHRHLQPLGYSGGKLALPQAVEELEGWHVATDRPRRKPGQRT